MQLKDKLFCNYNDFKFLPEEIFISNEIAFRVVSLTSNEYELMVFIEKCEHNGYYKVQIYKNSLVDTYIPHHEDNIVYHEENEYFAAFYFENYSLVKAFVSKLGYNHKEYRIRPYKKVAYKAECS